MSKVTSACVRWEWDAGKLFAEKVVVLCARALAHLRQNEHSGLVVRTRREGLGLHCRDGGVALDERGHDAAGGLDREGERRNVEGEDVPRLLRRVAGEDDGLDCGTVGDDLVGVNVAIEEVQHEPDNPRDTGGVADEDDPVYVRVVDLGIPGTFSTGSRLLWKRSWHSPSKQARVREV